MTRAMEMFQLPNQVDLGKIFRTHTRHVVSSGPKGLAGRSRHTGIGPTTARLGTLHQHAGSER